MLTSALECSVAVLHAIGHDEAAVVVAGALGAGVTTGVEHAVTGGLFADLGVADALQRARATLGEPVYGDALRRGAELSLDETVAYVLSVLDVAAPAVP